MTPGACIIKLITAVIYGFRNKLECLSLNTDQAGKACQGQTLQLITETEYYGHYKFYDTGPWPAKPAVENNHSIVPMDLTSSNLMDSYVTKFDSCKVAKGTHLYLKFNSWIRIAINISLGYLVLKSFQLMEGYMYRKSDSEPRSEKWVKTKKMPETAHLLLVNFEHKQIWLQ